MSESADRKRGAGVHGVSWPLFIDAPAKINLCLYMKRGRRRDRLHDLCSLFLSVSLFDELEVYSASGSGDEVHCPGIEGENLVSRALSAYRAGSEWSPPPLAVSIKKRIPSAAGLGGGSADAAAILRVLEALNPNSLGRRRLSKVAMEIGSDVPSQLDPGFWLVEGAGERLSPLAKPGSIGLVLVPGAAGLSTPAVYDAVDRLGSGRDSLDGVRSEIAAVGSGRLSAVDLVRLAHNDLEPAALDLCPSIGVTLRRLREAGALVARVTGSGPTTFGIFSSAAEAAAAAVELREFGARAVEPVFGSEIRSSR